MDFSGCCSEPCNCEISLNTVKIKLKISLIGINFFLKNKRVTGTSETNSFLIKKKIIPFFLALIFFMFFLILWKIYYKG